MRGGPFIFSLILLALAPVAGGRAADRPMASAPRKTSVPPAGLRGPATPAPKPAAPALASPPTGPAGLALRPSLSIASPRITPLASAATGAGECRLTCAHSYYFCLSGGDASFCPQAWTSCLTACVHTPLGATP